MSLLARWGRRLSLLLSLHAARPLVQESHATQVQALAFNHCDPQLGNLFTTVGADQATGAAAANATLPLVMMDCSAAGVPFTCTAYVQQSCCSTSHCSP